MRPETLAMRTDSNLPGLLAGTLLAASAVLVGPAQAQSWNGFYMGLNAGAAWTDSSVRNSVCESGTGCYFSAFGGFPGYGTNVNAAGSGSADDVAFTGGFQVGYNMHASGVLIGVEADLNLLRTDASRVARGNGGPSQPNGFLNLNDEISTTYLGTLRGRLGYAVGNTLLYVTGGLAYANFKHSHHAFETGVGVGCSDAANYCDIPGSSSRKLGWTIGAGAEWAMNRNWSVKAEYLYVDLGEVDSTSDMNRFSVPNGQGQSIIRHEADLSIHTVRAGINYRF
jgi:outer membrane immunogenic protein